MAAAGTDATSAAMVTSSDAVGAEILWLTALALAPLYFNVESAQHFEADKAVGIRVLAILALTIEIIRALRLPDLVASAKALLAGCLRDRPARAAGAGLALVVVSTAVSSSLSIEKHLSFWGGNARRQGAYTMLAYVVLFAVAAARLDAARVSRAVTIICQSAVAVCIYAVVQATGNDPIAWAADVARRPTSTFGNAGALAGYVVVAAPFLVARFSQTWTERSEKSPRPRDWTSTAALVGSHLFLFANVVVAGRSLGWFGEPLRLAIAIAVATASWALRGAVSSAQRRAFGSAVLLLALGWSAVTMTGVITKQMALTSGLSWCALGLSAMVAWAYRERGREATRGPASAIAVRLPLFANGVAVLACVAVVVLAQARGAQAALLATMLVFLNAGLLRPRRSAASRGSKRRLRLLVGSQVLVLAGMLFFNLSKLAVVERARHVPYLGRLGQWLATGEVNAHARIVIWTGDAYGTGVRGLVTRTPLRTIVGYGPETFREVFASTFPPSFVYGTGRDVTPDRAHQAALDVLVTQGVIGLVAVVIVFGAFLVLAARAAAAERPEDERLVAIACFAAIIAHLIDGAAGIPTTASMFTCWMIFAVATSLSRGSRATVRPTISPRSLRDRWGVVLMLGSAAAVAVWRGNVSSVIADMFLEGGTRSRDASMASLVRRCEATSSAIALAPRDGVYTSDLGQTLLLMSEQVRGGKRDVPASHPSACRTLATSASSRDLLLRARDSLELAERLEPRDKDRAAHLGQANLLLYREIREVSALDEGIAAFRRACALAPNDVVLTNQLAASLVHEEGFAEAEQLLGRSLMLDPDLMETRLQLAELLVLQGRTDEAVGSYARVLRESPSTLWSAEGSRAAGIVQKLGGEPARLRRLEVALAAHLDELRRDQRAVAPAQARDFDEEIRFEEQMLRTLAAPGR